MVTNYNEGGVLPIQQIPCRWRHNSVSREEWSGFDESKYMKSWAHWTKWIEFYILAYSTKSQLFCELDINKRNTFFALISTFFSLISSSTSAISMLEGLVDNTAIDRVVGFAISSFSRGGGGIFSSSCFSSPIETNNANTTQPLAEWAEKPVYNDIITRTWGLITSTFTRLHRSSDFRSRNSACETNSICSGTTNNFF